MSQFQYAEEIEMPRLPDPALEKRVIAAATRLLDRGGEASITLRAVAREAGTTTPTIYQRFRDRDDLMKGLVDWATTDLLTVLQRTDSIEEMFRAYLRHSRAHPMRMGLTVSTFGERYVKGEPTPAFDLLKERITSEIGIKGRAREDMALAIATLAFGTVQGIIATGDTPRLATQFQRTSLQALRMLLGAFSPTPKRRARFG